jgi:CBS-domain-containing membrane protein
MRAKNVMSRPVTITANATLRDAARVLVNSRFSALPVVDEKGAMIGIVSEVDLIRRVVGDEGDPTQLHAHLGDPDSQPALATPVVEVMTREVITADAETLLEDVASLILKHQKKRIPIIRDGGVVGIVSRTDLVKAMLSHGAPLTQPAAESPKTDGALRRQVATAIQKLNIPLGGSFDVVVRDGSAHLWGQVASVEEDRACEIAAAQVPGITGVMSHMQVVAPHLR